MGDKPRTPARIEAVGGHLVRYGLVLVLAWIGAMKFTLPEAEGIRGLIEGSPLLRWMYRVFDVRGASAAIGVVELITAGLIALRPWAPRASAAGSALAVCTFLTTLSFMLTAPIGDASLGGFPALNGSGQFLLKDVVLLGASVWSLGEARTAASRARGAAEGMDPPIPILAGDPTD